MQESQPAALPGLGMWSEQEGEQPCNSSVVFLSMKFHLLFLLYNFPGGLWHDC